MEDFYSNGIFTVILVIIVLVLFSSFRKKREEENTIKGDTFTARDETLEEKNDPIRNLIEEAKRVSETLKEQENKHK